MTEILSIAVGRGRYNRHRYELKRKENFMNRKMWFAALAGVLLLAQNALAIETPEGWKLEKDESGVIYSPENAEGREISVSISLPLPDEGKTAAQLLEDAVKGMTAEGDLKNIKGGKIEKKDKRAEVVMDVEVMGEPVRVKQVIYPIQKKSVRAIVIFMDGDADTLQRYQKTTDEIIEAQYAEDMARKK